MERCVRLLGAEDPVERLSSYVDEVGLRVESMLFRLSVL
jgi:hypothetical protein